MHCSVHPRNILKQAELASWNPGQGRFYFGFFSTAFRLFVPLAVCGCTMEQSGLSREIGLPCWRKSTAQQRKSRLALNIGLILRVIGLHPAGDSSTKLLEERFFMKSLLVIKYSCTYSPNSSESPKIPRHIFSRLSFFWAPSLQ